MTKIKIQYIKYSQLLIFLCILLSNNGFAQISGSLFMTPDNFYAQMFNPSFMRNDKVIEISVAGLGGFSFANKGSFKISDLITTPQGSPVVDPVNFYNAIPENNFFRQDLAVPMAFIHVPTKKGAISFFYKENAGSVFKFKNNVIEFLVNGNTEPEYEDYSTDAINIISTGYREFAFGYAKHVTKTLDVGINTKLLFGSRLLKA